MKKFTDTNGAHCQYCWAAVPLEQRGRYEVFAAHWLENDPVKDLCSGSGRPFVESGAGAIRKRRWHHRVIDRLRGR